LSFVGIKTASAGRESCENSINWLLPDFFRTEIVC
jgi:hypothetical protein